MLVTKNIENFRKGTIDGKKFLDFLKSQFSSKATDENLIDAWNAMCTMNDQAIENNKALSNFLQVHKDFKVVIVGATNSMHQNYIMQHLSLDESTIKTSFSYNHNTLHLPTLASTALQTLNDNKMIYSLHNKITGNNITSIRFNPSDDKLAVVLEQLLTTHYKKSSSSNLTVNYV